MLHNFLQLTILNQETKIWNIISSKYLSFEDYLKNKSLKEAGIAISNGHLVAFPTETVYGLGANAFSNTASSKIFKAKGRPSDNPLIVHISERSQLYEWILRPINPDYVIHPVIIKLMDSFWPGPLSIIFEYDCNENESDDDDQNIICSKVRGNGRLKSVAVRMPSNGIARALISLSGCPIAAPSANTSGRPSPTNSKHVINDLKGKIYGILDCGEVSCDVGLESTVVKMDEADNRIIILRPGGITKNMIVDAIGNNDVDVVYSKDIKKDKKQSGNESNIVEAPGMKYRHYAPNKPLYLVENIDLFCDIWWFYKLENEIDNVVFIVTKQNSLFSKAKENKNVLVIGDGDDLNEIASNLFLILRKIDDDAEYQNVKLIFCEVFDQNDIGVAIMNRLDKASQSNKVIIDLSNLQSLSV